MRAIVRVCLLGLLVGVSGFTCFGQEVTNVVSTAGTNGVISEAELARYATLNRREFELNTRVQLLSDLSSEHRLRAEAARENDKPQLEAWETDLARELSGRAARELTQLNAVSKERVAMEEARQVVAADPFEMGGPARTNVLTTDEAAFLGKLRERTWELEQELTAALEAGNVFALQLQTNSTPDEVGRVSFALEDNALRIRALQKQLSDLELMRLQFRALRAQR